MATPGTYNIVLNLSEMKLTMADPTGVENISGDDAEVRWFNLQGTEVSAPDCGIYIRVQGGKSTKVVIK